MAPPPLELALALSPEVSSLSPQAERAEVLGAVALVLGDAEVAAVPEAVAT